jgi:hypothetical protein
VQPPRPRRSATISVTGRNPIPEGNRAMISEDPAAKFGQLPSADMAAYEASVRVLLGQVMAVSALPAHYVGDDLQPLLRRRPEGR